LPDEEHCTSLLRRSLRLGRKTVRLAETILADPAVDTVDSATLDLLLQVLDRGIFAIDTLRTYASEEEELAARRRRSARVN
jgi:hypothetical protein